MSSIESIQKSWARYGDHLPFKAILPESSNGFVRVVDRDGREAACCYTCDAAGFATLIAEALNFVFTPVVPPEEPKSETPEGVVPT